MTGLQREEGSPDKGVWVHGGVTASCNCHLLQSRLQQQEGREKKPEIIRLDWIFSCGKCSATAQRHHTQFIPSTSPRRPDSPCWLPLAQRPSCAKRESVFRRRARTHARTHPCDHHHLCYSSFCKSVSSCLCLNLSFLVRGCAQGRRLSSVSAAHKTHCHD